MGRCIGNASTLSIVSIYFKGNLGIDLACVKEVSEEPKGAYSMQSCLTGHCVP